MQINTYKINLGNTEEVHKWKRNRKRNSYKLWTPFSLKQYKATSHIS